MVSTNLIGSGVVPEQLVGLPTFQAFIVPMQC